MEPAVEDASRTRRLADESRRGTATSAAARRRSSVSQRTTSRTAGACLKKTRILSENVQVHHFRYRVFQATHHQ